MADQDQLLEGVVGGVLKGGEEKDRVHMGSDGELARQRENELNEEREEVEGLSSPQGSLIQIEKRRLKADQRDLKWWMRTFRLTKEENYSIKIRGYCIGRLEHTRVKNKLRIKEFKEYVRNADILVIVETWMTTEDKIKVNGFKHINKSRKKKRKSRYIFRRSSHIM
jgi:hypothetical protein